MKLFNTQNSAGSDLGKTNVSAVVELFGNARLLAGRSTVHLELPTNVSATDVAGRLAREVPELVGEVVDPEGSLMTSYILNLNGTSFMSDSGRRITTGDRMLLFSSQAGG